MFRIRIFVLFYGFKRSEHDRWCNYPIQEISIMLTVVPKQNITISVPVGKSYFYRENVLYYDI